MPPELLERFWAYIEKSPEPDGCWIWTGCLNPPGKPRKKDRGQNKYPRPRFRVASGQRVNGQQLGQVHVYAARLTLALASGVTLDSVLGFEACHTCANPDHRCVNPYHLYWGTAEENRADRYAS